MLCGQRGRIAQRQRLYDDFLRERTTTEAGLSQFFDGDTAAHRERASAPPLNVQGCVSL